MENRQERNSCIRPESSGKECCVLAGIFGVRPDLTKSVLWSLVYYKQECKYHKWNIEWICFCLNFVLVSFITNRWDSRFSFNAVSIKMTVFWEVKTLVSLKFTKVIKDAYCLHKQGDNLFIIKIINCILKCPSQYTQTMWRTELFVVNCVGQKCFCTSISVWEKNIN